MWWRPKLPWRWIIRYFCLALLILCAGVWVSSHCFDAFFRHTGSRYVASVRVTGGRAILQWFDHSVSSTLYREGWIGEWHTVSLNRDVRQLLLDEDFLGIRLHRLPYIESNWVVRIPLWCPTALLAIGSWIAWRKTGRGKTGRGFWVEPLTSWPEKADG